MFNIVDFEIDHIKPLLAEPINEDKPHWREDDYKFPRRLMQSNYVTPMSVTVNDEVVMCIFLVEVWTGRAHVVCIFGEKVREHSIPVYRNLRKILRAQPYNRLEFDVPVGFELGHRRAMFMGFDLEIPVAKKYLPDGSDASLYAWVRE